MSTRAIGIDLGTTNSCVAILDNGEPFVIPNDEGGRTTPSVVGFGADGERLIGQMARRQAATNPEQTIYAAKRLIGRKVSDEEVRRYRDTVPYAIVPHDNGDAWLEINGEMVPPTQISAVILALFCILTAFIFHLDFSNQMQTIALLKNIGLAGGFILIALNGTKDWAVEKKKKYVRL